MIDNFRQRLKNREKLLGTMLSLPSASVAEVFANSGIDWLFIDAEHGPFETSDIQSVLQAVDRQVPCLVRVAAAEELPIKRALDAGAAGVIVPAVNTAEQAAEVVSYARYSPAGSRGVGIARAHGYGKSFSEYLEHANDQLSLVVQAEHALAAENIEAIIQVPGIDGVLIGPYDLSASFDKMGQLDDPQVVGAIDHITSVCLNAQMPLGIFGVTPEAVRPYLDRGFSLVVVGVDTMLLGTATESMMAELR